jgi:colanic acid biosynthesis glycosyl transferase WcaI
MRILIVSQYFWPENFRLNDLAIGLSDKGHQVTVLTGAPNYPDGKVFAQYKAHPKNFEKLGNIEICRVPLISRGSSKIRLAINYLSFLMSSCIIGSFKLRHAEFDKIFVYQVSPMTVGLTAVLFSRLKKAPIYFWVLDQWPETLVAMGIIKSKYSIAIFAAMTRFIYANCTAILGQSQPFLDKISEHGVEADRLYYFPNWAEDIFDNKTVKAAPEIKRDKTSFIILFAGNIGEAQGFDAVINAARETAIIPEIQWVIVGSGRNWHATNKQINELGLQNITLKGGYPLERMPEFYAASDALLVTLKRDILFNITIPGKLQSYMLAGKPILGMLDGAGADLIKQANAGLVCDAENFSQLAANALLLYRLSKKQQKEFGRRGREFAKKNFNRVDIIASLEDLFQNTPVNNGKIINDK